MIHHCGEGKGISWKVVKGDPGLQLCMRCRGQSVKIWNSDDAGDGLRAAIITKSSAFVSVLKKVISRYIL